MSNAIFCSYIIELKPKANVTFASYFMYNTYYGRDKDGGTASEKSFYK